MNNTNKTSTKSTKSTKKIIDMSGKMNESDSASLLARLAEMEKKLAEAEAAAASLAAKVKTSSKREQKAPDSYNVLQPIFVAVRGSVDKGIVDNSTLFEIMTIAADKLNITLTDVIGERLIAKTVQHNSVSNIAKADSISSAEGRKAAYLEMLKQAAFLLPNVSNETIDKFEKDYMVAYNEKLVKLK